MEELKLAVASNLIRLRNNSGMTQAQLGEKLSYSDKTISKWERAESVPDVASLKQIGDLFGVTVDYLIQTHDQWETPPTKGGGIFGRRYSRRAIIRLTLAAIWLAAVLAFVVGWMLDFVQWSIFVYVLPISLITHLVLHSIWCKGKNNGKIVAALVLSLLLVAYVAMIDRDYWQLFLLAIPAEIVVYFSFRLHNKKQEN